MERRQDGGIRESGLSQESSTLKSGVRVTPLRSHQRYLDADPSAVSLNVDTRLVPLKWETFPDTTGCP